MAKITPLKDRVSRTSIKALADHLLAADPRFPSDTFVYRAMRGLGALELKARIQHVAEALAESLPPQFDKAANLIDEANRIARSQSGGIPDSENATFVYWPLSSYVERYGLDHHKRALGTMHGLTALATCEFALRPYIERDQAGVFRTLTTWSSDGDHHVRRLVSEGTRPLLPWGGRLQRLRANPRPSIKLLDHLFDDTEPSVRRSAANHLNDISKDHPDLAVATAVRWSKKGLGKPVEWVVRHALRGLIKQGHTGALALQGVVRPRVELVAFTLSPTRLSFGDSIELSLELRSKAKQRLLIDYAVHHQKANGTLTPKVFKWVRKDVGSGERVVLNKLHAIRAISIRRYYEGEHRVELLVNGQSLALKRFELVGTA